MIRNIESMIDLNVHPCYKVESIMQKMDPTADISRPMSFNSSLPVPVDDMVEHRLGGHIFYNVTPASFHQYR